MIHDDPPRPFRHRTPHSAEVLIILASVGLHGALRLELVKVQAAPAASRRGMRMDGCSSDIFQLGWPETCHEGIELGQRNGVMNDHTQFENARMSWASERRGRNSVG